MRIPMFLILVVFLSVGSVEGQAKANVGNNRSKTVNTRIDRKAALAERLWEPFWSKFRATATEQNISKLSELMSADFSFQDSEGGRNVALRYFDDVDDDFTGGWETVKNEISKGVTPIIRKTANINCSGNARSLSRVALKN